jgi:hypothetical protein
MRLLRMAALLAGISLTGGFAAAILVAGEPKQTKNDIWLDEPKEMQPPWWQRDLSNETIDRIMKGIVKRDPAKAKQLNELRLKDLEKFKTQLREQGQPELDQMIRERLGVRRQERNAKFVEWLKANYPSDEQALAKLKERDPQLYISSFDHLMKQYGYIFEADSSSQELGRVLKQDFDLRKREEELCRQIRNEKSEAKQQALGAEFQDVVAKRFDLLVRRKEIAYEQLLKKLDELQQQIRESKDEIGKWRDPKVKQENVKQRIKDRTGNKVRFKWDD